MGRALVVAAILSLSSSCSRKTASSEAPPPTAAIQGQSAAVQLAVPPELVPRAAPALANEAARTLSREPAYFWFTGTAGFRDGHYEVNLSPVHHSFGARPAHPGVSAASAEFELQLRDAAGTLIMTVPIAVASVADATSRLGPFSAFVPWDERVKQVIAVAGGAEVARRTGSQHAPTVQIQEPLSGATIKPDDTLRWSWDDADGDSLSAVVEYSVDDGRSWQIYALDYDRNTMPLNVPGGPDGRLRVTVSDGFHVAVSEVERLAARGTPPEVYIRTRPFVELSNYQSVNFDANAIDPDEGSLPKSSIVWTSDRMEGELGRGDMSMIGKDLPEGRHVITATATDRDGAQGSASFRLNVMRSDARPKDFGLSLAVRSTHEGDFRAGKSARFDVSVMNEDPRAPVSRFFIADEVPGHFERAVGEHWTCLPREARALRCSYDGPPVHDGESSTVLSIYIVPNEKDATGRRISVNYEIRNTVWVTTERGIMASNTVHDSALVTVTGP